MPSHRPRFLMRCLEPLFVTFHVNSARPHRGNRFATAAAIRCTLIGQERGFGGEKRYLEIGKRKGSDLTRHLEEQVNGGGLCENADITNRHEVVGQISLEELRIFVLQRLPELLFCANYAGF